MLGKPELFALAREKWASSGLGDEQAKTLRLSVLTAAEVGALSPTFVKAGALRIPYFDVDGRPTKFYRLRYLEKLPGFAGIAKKPQRYVQPTGTLNEVYLPPLFDWATILTDPEIPLYLTEGEFKAAAGCIAGLATIGLGGVDVWRASKRGIEVLPTLDQTVWENREVTIVYDSDAATNPNVVRAQRQLAGELLARGARPAIASLPPDGDKKQGLDDFIVKFGAEALAEVLAASPMFPEAAALWELNEEVVYVKDPGFVIEKLTGQKMTPSGFSQHAYANRHYMETIVRRKTTTMEKKPLARRWLEWERRHELECVVYEPGHPNVFDNRWNQWKGWGCEPKAGDISPWTWLLDFIFHGAEPESRRWFEQWLAYPLQNPGTKMFSSAAIWGVFQGTGKTLVGHSMLKIYGDNGAEIKDPDLRGGFNEWAENKQFVVGDEVTGSDKREHADLLKGMITQEFLRINRKFIPSYVIRDCINYLFTSNHPDAFFLEDTDRRFFIHEIIGPPAPHALYLKYDRWLRKGEGPSALFHHLLSVDISDFNSKAPALSTRAKASMIADNKSELGHWCQQLKEDAEHTLRPLGTSKSNEVELLSSAQLLHTYDPDGVTKVTITGLGRELKRSGFRQVNMSQPVRTSAGLLRLYAIRNGDRWANAKPEEIVQHWEKYFGPKSKQF